MSGPYRSDVTAEALKATYGHAKRSVDSFTEKHGDRHRRNIGELEETLASVGYDRARKNIFVRENGDTMHVVSTNNLSTGKDGTCLYEAPTQSIDDFCKNINGYDPEKKKIYERLAADFGRVTIAVYVGLSGLAIAADDPSTGSLYVIGAHVAGLVGVIVVGVFWDHQSLYSHNNPIASGKKALYKAIKPTQEHKRIMEMQKYPSKYQRAWKKMNGPISELFKKPKVRVEIEPEEENVFEPATPNQTTSTSRTNRARAY